MSELALIKAAAKGDLKAVRGLLAAEHNVDERGEPLTEKELRTAKWVLNEAGADTVAEMVGRIFDITPLMAVAESGNEEIAEALIEAGADVNAQDSLRRSPLMTAIEWKREAIARRLLEAGADPNVKDLSGDPVLTQAIRQSLWPLSHALLDAGAKVQPRAKKDCLPIRAIAELSGDGVETVVLRLLEGGGRLKDEYAFSSLLGSLCGVAAEQLMITHKQFVESMSPDTLLGVASKARNLSLIKMLLANGIRPTNDPEVRSPLSELIIGPARVSSELYSVDFVDNRNDIACMAVLTEAGSDLDHASNVGRSPVAWAAAMYRSVLVQWLLENGADANQMSDSKSPLDIADQVLSAAMPSYELTESEREVFRSLEAEARKSISLLKKHGAESGTFEEEAEDEGGLPDYQVLQTPVAQRRGLCDTSFSKAEQIIIRADIDSIASVFQKDRKIERVERDVFGKLHEFDRPTGDVLALVKLKGHDWVYVAGGRRPRRDSPMKAWSKACKVPVLYAGEQSTAGVVHYSLYDQGDCVETFESDGQWFHGGVEIDPEVQNESERMHGTAFTSSRRDPESIDWPAYESEWDFLGRLFEEEDAYLTFVWAGFERQGGDQLVVTAYNEDEATAESIERVDLVFYKPTASQQLAAEQKPPEEDPLLQAIQARDLEAAKAAIAAGADAMQMPPQNDSTYLAIAAGYVVVGYLDREIIEMLLSAGVDPGDGGDKPMLTKIMRWASSSEALSIMARLIEAGADVNAQTPACQNAFMPHGETALVIAAQTGRLEYVELLLNKGADPTIQDSNDKAALEYAENWLRNVKKQQLSQSPEDIDKVELSDALAVVDQLEQALKHWST